MRCYRFLITVAIAIILCAAGSTILAQGLGDYEGRAVASVELVFDGSAADAAAQAELQALLKIRAGGEYSAVAARQSLGDLFASGRVASARIEITQPQDAGAKTSPINVRFIVKRQITISEIHLDLSTATGTPISNDEIRARINLLETGRRASQQAIARNLDEIQTYLVDHGYFNATVDHGEQLDATGARAIVTYKIAPGEPSHVATFTIDVPGFDEKSVRPSLKLQTGTLFTRDTLGTDTNTIRQAILAQGHLSPTLSDPRVERKPGTNDVEITLTGKIGPMVDVTVKDYDLSSKKQHDLLPIKREGNLDYSVIEEGARRVENDLQEHGYFFADVQSLCTVTPPTPNTVDNGTDATCQNLNPEEMSNSTIDVAYNVVRGRRFKLSQIRITGTNKLTVADVADELKTKTANVLGFLPFLGYGHGYTSNALLEEDRRTIAAHMTELGYRSADVKALQGASINGEDLIITFKVTEGALTRVASIEIQDAKALPEDRLRGQIRTIKGGPYSPSVVRADTDRLLNLYARAGYVDAQIDPSIVELPKTGGDEQVRIVLTVTKEGNKGIVNSIVVSGVTGSAETQRKKRDAIVRAVPLAEGDILRADRLTEAERALYLTDAYRQVIIRTEPAGEGPGGTKKYDVFIDVEEKKVRVVDYGGGYSTDTGALGLLEISNVNLMNKLRQGSVRLRISQRQQILRFEYLDPRFARYGEKKFAPLSVSLQYQRDSTITRFFRSTIDRGTFGIVQRLDANGNPIDVLGRQVGEPTINRFTFSIETQRVLSQKKRSFLFARYSYEDVRLRNIDSLLIQDILRPDDVVRLSRFGTSFVFDTREHCEPGVPGSSTSEEEVQRTGQVCRYSQLDATGGQFLSVDYSVALRGLGGNTSFSRFQSTYHIYHKVDRLRGTVLAGNLNVGLATLFNPRDRNGNGVIDDTDRLLPISERFFSGGSETLRGFAFQEAGPREAVFPQGAFRDASGKTVLLNPFTVPVGGNAVVVTNLEARVPLTKDLQVVPFYDGGNVFRRVGDIFGKAQADPASNSLVDRLNAQNLIAHWTNTVGLGFRIKTPFGGAVAVDYGFLLNPPRFMIPELDASGHLNSVGVFRLHQGQVQFRFSQTF